MGIRLRMYELRDLILEHKPCQLRQKPGSSFGVQGNAGRSPDTMVLHSTEENLERTTKPLLNWPESRSWKKRDRNYPV